ncbi:MAG TPA: hypothetical protein VM223_00930 [Planctomycetota bacterium]|nr:hypothetical protein [Planctomycetota bacterium]
MVWQGLGADALRPTLQYTDSFGNPGHIPLADLIRELASVAAPDESESADANLTVVAMPDHFTERPQENLLAALPWDRGKVRLLWRPVAAVLAWTENMSDQQMRELDGGRVAAVDIGNADISVTVLGLRKVERAGRQYLVPVRDLPEHRYFKMWPARPFDLATAESLFHIKEVWHGAEQVWQLCTGSDILLQDAGRVAPRACGRLLIATPDGWQNLQVTADELAQARRRALKDGPSESAGPLLRHLEAARTQAGHTSSVGASRHMAVLRDKLPSWIRDLGGEPFPMLLFGSVTEVRIDEGRTLACEMVEELYRQNPRQVPPSCPGRGLPVSGVVSRGCAVYGIREQMKLPTYFERLPRFRVLGVDEVTLEPVDVDLITVHGDGQEGVAAVGNEEGQRLAEGGKPYRKQLPHVAKIVRGNRAVCFRLKREEVEKQLVQDFGFASVRDCILSFDVCMRPAQGFAVVRIIPDAPGFFGGNEVVLDWDRMEPAKERKMGWPECAPLELSAGATAKDNAKKAIRDYVDLVRWKWWPDAEAKLAVVASRMQSGRTMGSDPQGADDLLDALGAHYGYYVQQGTFGQHVAGRADATKKLKTLMRAASALFSRTPNWAVGFLEQEFKRVLRDRPDDPKPTPVFLHAAGRCFSCYDHVRLFAECMHARFQSCLHAADVGDLPSLRMNNWCKALYLILRLNSGAVAAIGAQRADQLAGELAELLDFERNEHEHEGRQGISDPYKYAMRALFYLLRVRMRHGRFLTDWQEEGTVANRICLNLEATNNTRTGWPAPVLHAAPGETMQTCLLRFLRSEATAIDLRILRRAEIQMDEGSPSEEEEA